MKDAIRSGQRERHWRRREKSSRHSRRELVDVQRDIPDRQQKKKRRETAIDAIERARRENDEREHAEQDEFFGITNPAIENRQDAGRQEIRQRHHDPCPFLQPHGDTGDRQKRNEKTAIDAEDQGQSSRAIAPALELAAVIGDVSECVGIKKLRRSHERHAPRGRVFKSEIARASGVASQIERGHDGDRADAESEEECYNAPHPALRATLSRRERDDEKQNRRLHDHRLLRSQQQHA